MKKITIYFVLASLLIFAVGTKIQAQNVVGTIPGRINVGSSGAASYTIPIDVPAGINGMQPNISLVYNSQGGNGPLGMGWGISGLSSITRTSKNIFSNNTLSGNVLYSNVFALDGNRLKVKKSANWTTIYGSYFNVSGDGEYPPENGNNLVGDTYETENKTYSKIETFGTNYTYTSEQSGCKYVHGQIVSCTTTDWSATPGEPNLFKVTTKDGQVIEYGFKHCLRAADNSSLEWLISKVTDSNGNYMTFTYQSQGSQTVIQKIEYTGNGSKLPYASIIFTYSDKMYVSKTYIDGSYLEDRLLLNNIQTKLNNTLVKQYNLDYNYQKEKYFLKNVGLVGVNNEKLNSTVIEWGNDNSNIAVSTFPVPTLNNQDFIDGNNVKSWFSADVNGDGLTDLACCFKATKYVSDLYFDTYTCSLDNSGKPTFSLKSSQIINDFTGLSSGSFFVLPSPVFRTPPISYADLKGDKNKVTVYPKWIGGPTNAFRFKVEGADDRIETSLVGTEMPAFSIADINNDGVDEIITVEKGIANNTVVAKICYSKSLTDYSWKTINLTINSTPKDILVEDFNGDGLKDILIATDNGVFFYKNNGGGFSADNYITVSFSYAVSLSTFNANYSAIKVGDFNRDGLLDFILNEHCNSNWKLALNNGNWGFNISSLTNFTAVEESYTDKNDNKEDCIVTDFNNDGKSDVILIDPVYNTSGGFVQTNVTWYASTGTGFTVAKNFTTYDENYTFNRFNVLGDFDGDGREELFTYGSDIYNGGNKADMAYMHSSPNTNSEAGLVKSITDGFGNKTSINYLPITHSVTSDNKPFYTKGSGSVYPVADLQASVYCVSQLLEPDGLGGLNTTEFAYSEARMQQTGRGFLGFKTQTISNATTNRKIVSSTDMNLTYYLPDKETTEISTTGGAAVSKTENYYTNSKTGSVYLSQPSQTVETDYLNDLTKTTNYLSFDAYGNATSVRTTQGDLITTQNSTYVQKGSWCPNKPETVSITRQQGGDSYTRSKSYTYDDKGNLTKEITDPGDTNQLTVEYKNWNVFGQPTTTETTANGILRTGSIGFTPSGRFIQNKTDVLGQTTTYNWDETRGLLNSETNRLGTTTYTYNGLGQLTNTLYPDGTQKSQTAQWALAGNNFGAKFYITQQVSGSAASYTWFDALQREVVRENSGLKGNISRVFTQYRTDGKTYRVSAPTFDSQPTAWDAVYDYYPEGRLKTVVTPKGTTTTTYGSKTTTVTSPEGTQATALNAAGQTVTSTVNGKTVTYAYYASGKVKTATPDGGAAVAMEYDLQGNRTKLTDPDAGVSTAGYNGYGELKWEKQTNNAAQGEITTTYNYNAATGQIESRVRNGETTSYGYDTYKRLSTVEIAGQHKQTYAYGDYDRVATLTELINGTKTLVKGLEYDAYGRVNKETFPSGYYTVNNYDSYGNLSEVTDRSGRSVWKATEANARGQLTRVSKGAKETVYGYDDTKGQLTSMTATGVVNYGYSYDVKNNLEYRSDNLLGQKEHFSYDTQNRLTNWDIMNSSNVVLKPNSITYDGSTGNITAKSDLNSPATVAFNYEKTTNPRALTTITPQSSIISGDELTVTYTDFRKIKTLTEGNKQYTISYGVDDQRRRSVQTQGGTSLTRYYLGDYEEETDQLGNVKKIHYLSGGSQLISQNGVETLYYGYTDNQGSLVALTDVSGNVVEKYAYDPWGARRNPNDWQLKDTRSSFITNRGYTGHEHLDLFNIINMNGRVYDPLTAMFFSPDPFIQSPDNWLNYNRYSYCLNNPTMFIDPTGYQSIKQYEDGNSSPWSVFDQLAQTERRLGISNGSIGSGGGNNGFNWYNDYIQAMSAGYYLGMSKFRTEYEKQIHNQNFNGTVTLSYRVGSYIDRTNAGGNIYGYTLPELVTIWKSIRINVSNGAGRSSNARGIASAVSNFFSEHFYVGAEGEISYGVQLAGMIKKGVGVNINPVSQIVAEGSISNRGHSIDNYSIQNAGSAEKVKALDFGVAWIIGGNYNWNVVNGQMVSQTASLGVYGFGGNLTWDNSGVSNLFVGFELGGKVAIGWGASGSVKIGFTWNFK